MEKIQKGPGLVHSLIYDPKGSDTVANLSRILKSLGDLTEDISEDGKKDTKGLITNLKKASSDLSEILAGIRRGEGTVGMLIRDPELYNEMKALLGKANRSKLMKTVIRATLQENDKQVMQ